MSIIFMICFKWGVFEKEKEKNKKNKKTLLSLSDSSIKELTKEVCKMNNTEMERSLNVTSFFD